MQGGRQRYKAHMGAFRNALKHNYLNDLGWRGEKYTLSIKHGDEKFIKERLDKVVANLEWYKFFKEVWVDLLTVGTLDHNPILLSINEIHTSPRHRKKLFKYDIKWEIDEDCGRVIDTKWSTDQ